MEIICDVCGAKNSSEDIFCQVCSGPINVVRLSDLSADDLEYALSALLFSVSKSRLAYLDKRPKRIHNRFLCPFLNLEWLRPGSAVWNAILANLLNEIEFARPSMDLGCGDGTFMTVVGGGEFHETFDLMVVTDILRRDIYDYHEEGIISKYVKKECEFIDIGLDIKESLLKKARETGTYQKVVRGDGHKLPFAENSFKTIWTNVIKDFREIDLALHEIYRVLDNGGVLISLFPTNKFWQNLYYYPRYLDASDTTQKERFFRLNRGRAEYHPHYHTLEEWVERVESTGLNVVKKWTLLSPDLIEFWDTGLRPFSPFLIRISRTLHELGLLVTVKRKVVDFYEKYLQMYVDMDCAYSGVEEGAFVLLVGMKGA